MLSVLFLGIVALLGTGTRLTAPVLTMRRMYTQQDHIWGETLQLVCRRHITMHISCIWIKAII